MLGVLARVTVLAFLAVMLAAWAVNAVSGESNQPKRDQPVQRIYS